MKADTFSMLCIENPIASNPQDNPEGESFESTARAYIVFIDFNAKEIVRPEIGNSMEVEILDTEAADGIVTSSDAQENPNETPKEGHETEFGNEDEVNMFGEDDDEDSLNTWLGVVVERTDITPPGYMTLVLERGRAPGFNGPRSHRPFVNTPLTTVNYRMANSTAELAEMVARGRTTAVKLSMHYSRQGFKDQVRCADQLWRSDDSQKKRISQALLAHDTDNSPLQRMDIIALKGKSRVDMSSAFNRAQLEAHKSFRNTPEVAFIHGSFGTGKTLLCLSAAVEVLSNPDEKSQVLYLVDSNQAVDDATLKWNKMLKSAGTQKNIFRVHSLKSEKNRVYQYFDTLGQAQERFNLSDAFLNNFASLKLSRGHQDVRRRGDPRRVLDDMSLAAAMHRKLETSDEMKWRALKDMLKDYGEDGFHDTELSKRTTIKLELNELMAQTLQAADGITTTLANAANVSLAPNFKPVLVILDEAARVTELNALIAFGSYSPRAFLLAADHKQMRCTVLSAGKWKDPVAPYLNPFENQMLLSLFERAVLAGYEQILLTVQHRCKGDIPDFVTAAFYNCRISKSPLVRGEKKTLEDMRDFVHQKLGAKVRTNPYAVNIEKSRSSKELGGTSSFNEDEINEIIKDQAIMRKDPLFKGKTFCVISFYKAQVTKLKARLREFDDVTVLEGDEFMVNLAMTADASQGREFDVVQLSCVRTKGVAFLGEPHRLVVALTRSKWILGIYTNWDLVDVERVTSESRHLVALFENLNKTNRVIDRAARMLVKCNNCKTAGICPKIVHSQKLLSADAATNWVTLTTFGITIQKIAITLVRIIG